MGNLVYFVSDESRIEEKAGTFVVSFPSGTEMVPVALTPHQLMHLCQLGLRRYEEWDARHLETITPFPTDRRRKGA